MGNKGDRKIAFVLVDDDAVGLERFSPQRAVWKRSAIRYVLAAQNHLRKTDGGDDTAAAAHYYTNATNNNNDAKEEYVRRVSLRCTRWARQTAREQGFHDYCAAYDLDPSSFRRKRGSGGDGSSGSSKNRNK